MNAFEQILFWCIVQVTVMAVAAIVIGAIIGRRRPAAGAVVAAAALTAIIGLSAMAISPWPAWSFSRDGQSGSQATDSPEAVADNPVPRDAAVASNWPAAEEAGGESSAPMALLNPREQIASLLSRSWAALIGNWGVLLAVVYLIGVAGMALRIGLGLVAVRGYRRSSRPITDPLLGELLDVLCAELGCCHDVELRETVQLATPATIGWRRPILLLPRDWPSWTADERHAVLAHEIAHVRRGDFTSWMFAQIGVALHFYHPLVHWLANRLRLEQELAADAAAARVVGGQRKYVTTLAAMALRQSDAPVAWPARAFLPTSKTFLRRIEMLHRSKSIHSDVSRPLVFSSVAAIILAAVCAAGFRSTAAGDDRAAALESPALLIAENPSGPESNVAPNKTQLAVAAFRSQNNLKQLALAMHNYHDRNKHFPPAVVMGPDGKTPHSWRVELLPYLDQKALYEKYRLNESWDTPHNKKVLEQMPTAFRSPFDDPQSTDSGYYVLVGPGTMFEGAEGIKIQQTTDGTSNTLLIVEAKRNIPWTKPEDIPFDPDKPLPELGGFVKGQFAAALGDGSARTYDVEKAKSQLKWLIMRNDNHPIDREKIGLAQPRFPARTERRRPQSAASRSQNNLKQLGLAMHNYHDVFGHFPPAVVMGPDGKTPRSWRVELLAFVQGGLYQRYKKDEPWDSPANKKVLDNIPDVFKSPFDDPNTTNSGYFALVGRGTMFEGKDGVKVREVTDGTSNTILIVESKRSIPWTKPEDIPFDPEKPLPKLGGFVEGEFAAVLADGAALRFDDEKTKPELKWLIMRNDGHPVELP